MSKLDWQRANELIDKSTRVVAGDPLVANPLVSVCVQTFNHGKYITQAIDSVLKQNTNFRYEILIGDDQSNDGTQEIVTEYFADHPDKIKLIESTSNLGHITGNGRLNLIRNLRNARGKYIAFLEGDDFWCDDNKLQQQFDILETDPSLGAVTHDTDVLFEDTSERRLWRDAGDLVEFSLADLIAVECAFHTSSFFFRREAVGDLPEFFLHVQSSDIAMFMFAANLGQVRRIPEVMSVYRKNSGGVTTHANHKGLQFELNRIELHQNMMRYLNKHHRKFKTVINKHARRAIAVSLKRGWLTVPGSLCRIAGSIGLGGVIRLFGGNAA